MIFSLSTFLFPFLISFGLSILFTYLCIKIALALKIVDKPNMARKKHKRTTPLIGGSAIYLSFTITLIIFSLITSEFLSGFLEVKHLIGISLGGLFLIIGGILDDKYNLSPLKQLIWPFLSIISIIVSGIGIEYISNPLGESINLASIQIEIFEISNTPFFLTLLADIFTISWILIITYTTKILDGVDGLVSGITTISAFVICFLSLKPEVMQPETAILCIILAGATAGFLVFNFHPAKIFLGEGGSTFCGFIIAVLAIISGGKLATALLLLFIPLLDLVLVIIQRIFTKKSPFKTSDRIHLHFRLVDAGFGIKKTVLVYYVLTILLGISALASAGVEKIYMFVFSIFLIVVLFIISFRSENNTKIKHEIK